MSARHRAPSPRRGATLAYFLSLLIGCLVVAGIALRVAHANNTALPDAHATTTSGRSVAEQSAAHTNNAPATGAEDASLSSTTAQRMSASTSRDARRAKGVHPPQIAADPSGDAPAAATSASSSSSSSDSSRVSTGSTQASSPGAPVLSNAVTEPVFAPRVALTSPAPASLSAGPELGVQYNGTWSLYSDADRTNVLTQLRAAGATWVRIDVSWATLQPQRAGFDQTWGVPFINGVLQQAHSMGFKVLVTFWQSPQWANNSTNPNVPPADPAQFAAAAAKAVQLWGSIVNGWEIWNEPNSNDYFVGTNPAQYVKLLCAANAQIKAVDPSATVLFGGLMYADDGWFKQAYAAGPHGCFDVLAVHPFEGPSAAAPETADDGNPWHLTHLPSVRAVMTANGDGALPVWFTEFGWSTGAPPNAPPWHTGVSPTVQADYLQRAVAYTRANYPYVTNMFWFRDADQHTSNVHEDGFGLLTQQLTPKPALAAFKLAATEGLR